MFVGCVEHGDDILRRHAGLDVVDAVEDVAAAGFEDVEILADVLFNFLRAGKTKHVLRVDAAAPEDQGVSKLGARVKWCSNSRSPACLPDIYGMTVTW